jgi:hypothetical protein
MQAAWTTNCKHTTTTEQTWPTRAHKLSPWSPARLFQHWRPTGHCAPGMTHAPPSSLTAASPCDVDAPLRVATEFLWAAPSPCSMHASMWPGPPSSIASLISADQFSVWRHRSQIDRCHRCHPFARRSTSVMKTPLKNLRTHIVHSIYSPPSFILGLQAAGAPSRYRSQGAHTLQVLDPADSPASTSRSDPRRKKPSWKLIHLGKLYT